MSNDDNVSMKKFYALYLVTVVLAGIAILISGFYKPDSLPEFGAFLILSVAGGTFIMFCLYVGNLLAHPVTSL